MREKINLVEKYLYWKTGKFEKFQEKMLRKTVRHAYENSPLYKKKLDEAGITPTDIQNLNDLRKLPFTTKDELKEAYPFGTLAVPKKNLRIFKSGGTSGEPTWSFYSEKDWNELVISRAKIMLKDYVSDEDVFLDLYPSGLMISGPQMDDALREMGVTVLAVGLLDAGAPYDLRLKVMKDMGVTLLACIPIDALRLAEIAIETGWNPKKDFNLRMISCSCDSCSDSIKEKIEEVWGVRVIRQYGMTELGAMAISCMRNNPDEKYHLLVDRYVPEVINPKTGELCEDGEMGELVVTTISREASPLLRYRTGDLVVVNKEPCKCGLNTPTVDFIYRAKYVMEINSKKIVPDRIENIIFREEGVGIFYKIIIETINGEDVINLEIETLKSAPLNDPKSLIKSLEMKLENDLGVKTHVKLVKPESIMGLRDLRISHAERETGRLPIIIDRRVHSN